MSAAEPNGCFRIAILVGSVRPGNYTSKAVALVVDELQQHADAEPMVIDATRMELQLPGVAGESTDAADMRDAVSSANGVIFATPEYHGSFSSVTKLIIDNLGFPSVLSGKSMALLGVAAGRIGAIKALEHLRSVCSHIGAIVLPGPVSVANVREVFNADGTCADPQIEEQIRKVPQNLLEYLRDTAYAAPCLEEMVRERSG